MSSPLRASNEGLLRPRVARAQGSHRAIPPPAGRFFQHPLVGDDAGARRLHLKDLNGGEHALGRVIEDEAGIGHVGVEQLVLSTTEIDVAVIDRAVLVDVVVERQLRFAERLSLDQNILRRLAHVHFLRRAL